MQPRHTRYATKLTLLVLLAVGPGCVSFTPFRPTVMPCIESFNRTGSTGTANRSAPGGGEPVVRIQTGHAGPLMWIGLTPDGRHAVVGEGTPPRVKLWDIEAGREVLTYPFNEAMLAGVHVSADGQRVLVDSQISGLQVFDLLTGAPMTSCREDSPGLAARIAMARFSKNGKYGTAFDPSGWQTQDYKADLWEISSGQKLASFPTQIQVGAHFSPESDAILVATAADRIQLFDVKTFAPVKTWNVPGGVTAMTFSADGKTVFAVNATGSLHAFDRASGAASGEPLPLGAVKSVTALAAAPDGRLILGDREGRLSTFDVAARRIERRFATAGHPAAAATPDGARLFIGTPGKHFFWKLTEGRPESIWSPEREGQTEAALFLPDGKRLVVMRRVGAELFVELMDMTERRLVWSAPAPANAMVAARQLSSTREGRFVLANYLRLVGDRMIPSTQVLDSATGRVVQTLELSGSGTLATQFPASGMTGGRLALATRTGVGGDKLLILEAASGARVLEHDTDVMLTGLNVSADGERVLLSGIQTAGVMEGGKSTYGVWAFDPRTKTLRLEADTEPIFTQYAVNGPGGQLLFGGMDHSSQERGALKIRNKIEFRNGSGTTRPLAEQTLRWGAFTNGGRRMLWVGDDGFVHVTDGDGNELVRFASLDDGEWVTMTPEGFFGASDNGAQYLSVRTGNASFAIDQFYEKLYRPDLVLAALTEQQEAIAPPSVSLAAVMQQGPPPKVRIVSPAAGMQQKRDVEIEVELADLGGGIGKVEWRINGAVVGIAGERGFVRAGAAKLETRREKKVITLSPGENRIEVVAYNAEGGAFSMPAVVELAMKDEISEPPALYVLAIAINQYRDRSLKLSYAVPDAKSLASSLRQRAKTVFSRVETTLLTDADATAAKIAEAFAALAGKVKTNDVFVLFVAGHGITQDGRYHFLPVDFRYTNEDSIRKSAVNQDDLQKWMSSVTAKKSLVLLDTCNSGSFVQAQAVTRGIQEKTAIDKLTRATGRATIAASTDTQVALEGHNGHGVFTWTVLDALAKADRDFGNRDGIVTTTELAAFINEHVPGITYKRWGYEQVPQVNLHGREFPIGVTGAQ